VAIFSDKIIYGNISSVKLIIDTINKKQKPIYYDQFIKDLYLALPPSPIVVIYHQIDKNGNPYVAFSLTMEKFNSTDVLIEVLVRTYKINYNKIAEDWIKFITEESIRAQYNEKSLFSKEGFYDAGYEIVTINGNKFLKITAKSKNENYKEALKQMIISLYIALNT